MTRKTGMKRSFIHAVAAHNNNVSRGTGLAPNEVHIGRYPRLPMTISEGRGAKGHQGLKQDQLNYLELMRGRQVKTYELVKGEDRLIKARHEAANENLIEMINRRPKYEVESWVWIYDDKSTLSGGRQHVLKTSEADYRSKKLALTAKLAQCWTGPYKILFVGPGTTSDGEKVGPNLLLVEVRKDEPGREINARVS